MEESAMIETLKTSLLANIWVERYNMVILLLTGFISIYARLSLVLFFETLLGMFLFTGIVALGFVAIPAHIKYYFYFERNRKVELYADNLSVKVNDQVIMQIFKSDITRIILSDRLRSSGSNFYMSLLDPFYYLVVLGKNQEKIILTCLLDIKLKKKITTWYGQELEHKYQFFPFPADS